MKNSLSTSLIYDGKKPTIVGEMPTKSLIDSLFPKSRQRILKELILNSQKSIHLRELARKTGLHPKTIKGELDNLLSTGIVLEEISGNQKLYRINKRCQIYQDLKMIVVKTIGVADEIRKALNPLVERVVLQ